MFFQIFVSKVYRPGFFGKIIAYEQYNLIDKPSSFLEFMVLIF